MSKLVRCDSCGLEHVEWTALPHWRLVAEGVGITGEPPRDFCTLQCLAKWIAEKGEKVQADL